MSFVTTRAGQMPPWATENLTGPVRTSAALLSQQESAIRLARDGNGVM